jgi:predicted phosphodiesterase
MKRILFIPDTHIPYHDKRSWRLMLKAATKFKPHTIVIIGDFADCYDVSDHIKGLDRRYSFKEEVIAVNKALDQLDILGADKKIYLEGNHEDRLPRYLARQARELGGIISIQELYSLKQRKWLFVPYKSDYRLGRVTLCHDADHVGKFAMWQTQAAYQENVVFGHTHRLGIIYTGTARGKTQVCCNLGWLGDKKYIAYKKKVKAHTSYISGFGIGYMEPNGIIHIQAIPIINYRCVIDGILYQG